MASKPTEDAENQFRASARKFRELSNIEQDRIKREEYYGFAAAIEGMMYLSVGVRATYMLLEDVKKMLEQQARRP